MKALKTIATIVLGIGALAIFNESESYLPNLVGIACFCLALYINRDKAQEAQ